MRRLGFVLGLAASGCTLLGFDELELVACRENTVCDELNVAHGLDVTKAAAVYQCASDHQGCVLSPTDWDDDGALAMGPDGERDCDDGQVLAYPGGRELCDELDNDCDGVIDEGVYAEALPRGLVDLGPVLSVDFGSLTSGAASGSLDLWAVARREKVDPDKEPPPGLGTLRVLTSQDTVGWELDVSSDDKETPSCPQASGDPTAHVPCYPAAFATDGESRSVRLAAAVDYLGCALGRLRFGQVQGDRVRLPSAQGLCGGAFPFVAGDANDAVCTARDDVVGVSRVELAQLPGRTDAVPTQALAAWIGTHELAHDACGRMKNTPVPSNPVDSLSRTSVGVAAMGFWPDVEAGTLSSTGTEGLAQPELLGFTRGGSAPAIEPLLLPDGSEHYIVAFGSEQGPSMRAIERVVTPAEMCGEGALPALSMRTAEPWDDAESTHFAADQLVVARGPVLDHACGTQRPGARLGVAWIERCGNPDAELWFATVDFSPSTGFCNPSVPQRASRFDHTVLAGQAGARLEPVLAHVQQGVLRDSRMGAFVLAWIEGQGRVRARRADADQASFVDDAIDLGVTGAHALGARRLLEGHLELEVVRANGDSLELAPRRLSGGCGG